MPQFARGSNVCYYAERSCSPNLPTFSGFTTRQKNRNHQVRRTAPPPDRRALAVALVIILGIALDIAGALHVYGLSRFMGQRLAAAVALLSTGVAAGWLLVAAPAWLRLPTLAVPGARLLVRRVLAGLMLAAWLATWRDFKVFLVPTGQFTLLHILLFGGVALVLLAALLRPVSPGWLVLTAALSGVLARLVSFRYVPIDPSRADMLPLVQQALATLLSGHSPYTTYTMPWELPLTYLPLTWLAYLPAHLVHPDIRLTNVVAELAAGGTLLVLAAAQHPAAGGSAWRAALAWVWHEEDGLLLWGWVFLQPTVLHWCQISTAPVWWALLSITLALVVARRHRLAAVALGLCAAASPMAAILAPFVLLRWLWAVGWKRSGALALAAALVVALFVLPFLLWSPHQFIYGTWRWFNDNSLFPLLKWKMERTWSFMPGFSGLFWRYNLVGLLKPIQAALLAGLLVLYAHWKADTWQIAPFAAAAFLLFMVFNPVLWPYLYNPALVAALVAVVALRSTPTP